jgi:hypothetical protein
MRKIFLVGVLLAACFVPPASASCVSGAVGLCVGDMSAPTSAGGTFHVNWSFPLAVDTNSQFFVVSVEIDTTAAGQTLVLPAASAWNYLGCSYVSETVQGVAGVVKTTNAKLQMTSPFCVIWFSPSSTNTAGGQTTSILSLAMHVEAQTVPVVNTVSGDLNAHVCAAAPGCATPTVNGVLSGTVNTPLSGSVSAALSGTVNTPLSGSVNAALSGTVNTPLSGSVNAAISGTVNTVQSGTLNVAQAGGNAWALTMPSGLHLTVDGGTLNAILSGAIKTNSTTTLIGNSSTVLHFPEVIHVCGIPATNGTCDPIQNNSPHLLDQASMFLGSIAWLLWILVAVLIRLLKNPQLRILAGLIGWAVLAFPMTLLRFNLLVVGNAALLVYDSFALMKKK